MDKMIQKEKYRVVLINMINNKEIFQVFVPSRLALGELMTILPSSVYFVSTVEVLDSVKEFKDFFNDLAEKKYGNINKIIQKYDSIEDIYPEDLKNFKDNDKFPPEL